MSEPSIAETKIPDQSESAVLTIPNESQGRRLNQVLPQIIADFPGNRLTN